MLVPQLKLLKKQIAVTGAVVKIEVNVGVHSVY